MLLLVPVLFSILVLVLASSHTNESNLNLLKNRERSRTESYVSNAKSSLIPIPKSGKPQSNGSHMASSVHSYSDKIIFSPKHIDEAKSPIARMNFIEQYLRDSNTSNDAKETVEDAKKEGDSETSSDDENEDQQEELIFDMDPFETGLSK